MPSIADQDRGISGETVTRGHQLVVTYSYAYVRGEIDLCARHAEHYSVPLGPVQHGLHEGYCDHCDRLYRRRS